MAHKIVLSSLIAIFAFACECHAHFGMLIPSRSMVLNSKEAGIQLEIAFSHPFAGIGMAMPKPRETFAWLNGNKINLETTPASYMGQPSFQAPYHIPRPGVYQFGIVPEPYYEQAEDCYIIHYTKTVVGAFGYEDGWETPIGLPVEIVPLTRPFGNYAGNTFTGITLKNGKPLPYAEVEVEFLNSGRRYVAPNPYFVTQRLRTDANGLFTFGIPWPGWWGFAALTEAEEKIDHEGKPKNVELGGVIWLEFYAPEKEN